MRLWTLWGFDSRTGAATHPVGAVGTESDRYHVSLIPLEPAADPWRDVLRCHPPRLTELLTHWERHANGVTMAIAALPPPAVGIDLATAVERVVDDLLCLELRRG